MRNFFNLTFIVLVSITSLMLSACSKDDATKDGDKSNGENAYSGGYPFSISGDIRSLPS